MLSILQVDQQQKYRSFIRSTLKSRPNEVGLKCLHVCKYVHMYVHTSICPQKVSLISMKFGLLVEVDE